VRFREQCTEGKHQGPEHEQGHHQGEDQRTARWSNAPRQRRHEPPVERPARDRSHTRGEQSLKEAVQYPDRQNDDQRAAEPARGKLDLYVEEIS
jgi:hypothetical protein